MSAHRSDEYVIAGGTATFGQEDGHNTGIATLALVWSPRAVEACNIARSPVIKFTVAKLTRDRLAHVSGNSLRLDVIRAANAKLIEV